MKNILFVGLMMLSSAVFADTTVFTLGPPHVNTIPVLTQDGVPTSGLWSDNYVYDCALSPVCTGAPQANLLFDLPNDPTSPGNRLFLNGCAGTVIQDTRPWVSKYQLPAGVLTSAVICGTWTGTITYNYQSVLQKHCSGRACILEYYPVLVSGSGELTSP